MIFRNRILLKSVALFFLLEMLCGTLSPAISWALTAGPTAPEATSFEPIDTTDLVNPATGDLVYNIPLLEVPGPSGGYPISMSYHPGIMPNEEASWVGLGWTLNTGSITRSVNGFADDMVNEGNFSRFFWEGGERKTYSIGVSVGVGNSPASVSAGLSFSQDTYQGSGVGFSLGAGGAISDKIPLGIGLSFGSSPYGQSYLSMGSQVSVGKSTTSANRLGTGVGFNLSSGSNLGFNASISYGASYEGTSYNALGASIATNGKSFSHQVSVAGASFNSNSRSSYVKTVSNGFNLPIPIGAVSINIGYEYQRYFIDNMDNFEINGSLYFPDNSTGLSTLYFDDKAFDTYSLLDPNLDGGIVDNPEPDKVMGGSFPGFDNYAVQAQGLHGNMRPFYFQKHLYKRNNFVRNSDGGRSYSTIQFDVAKDNPGERNMRAEFRFLNDFANRFEYDPGQIQLNESDTPLSYSFDSGSSPKIGEQGESTYSSNLIQGSRYIDWFTNEEIVERNSRVASVGFIETVSTGFMRDISDNSERHKIGGFVIVNESGVKYHFALPAYSYSEYMYSENRGLHKTFNEFNRPAKYAYTWYLTAITGPDFVDRGPSGDGDGKLNEYDWGYWVEFEYGKWTNDYAWRNPSEGMNVDIDQDFQNFSEGKKEVYYLDAVRTKSHTALFVKDIRHDAKSTLYFERDEHNESTFQNNPRTRVTTDEKTKLGGFIPKPDTCYCIKSYSDEIVDSTVYVSDHGVLQYTSLPTSSMKLNSILLIENRFIDAIDKSSGIEFGQSSQLTWNVTNNSLPTEFEQCDFTNRSIDYHLYNNVFDIFDLASSPELMTNSLRSVNFDTDYSLSSGTTNSFDYRIVNGSNPTDPASYAHFGKLTLKKLQFVGKGGMGSELLPPVYFKYELEEDWHLGSIIKGDEGIQLRISNSHFQKGDLIKFVIDSISYYALIERIENETHSLKILADMEPPPVSTVNVTKTKNPPYHREFYDVWGLYKSDYMEGSDEKISRLVSNLSAKSLDVWSLQRIITPTGAAIQIDYESDTYGRPALQLSNDLIIKDVQKVGGLSHIVLETAFPNIQDVFAPGSEVSYSILFADIFNQQCETGGQSDDLSAFDKNLQTGTIVVTDLFMQEGDWVLSTESNLENLYRIKPDVTDADHCQFGFLRKYESPVFIAGNISTNSQVLNYGGGLRVKRIGVISGLERSFTEYTYDEIGSSRFTSGVTSYEPVGLNKVKFNIPNTIYFQDERYVESLKKEYKKEYYKQFTNLLAHSREVPPPGVVYQYVTVSESRESGNTQILFDHYTTYEFEVFDQDMVALHYSPVTSQDFSQKSHEGYIKYSRKEVRNITLKDRSAKVGALLRVALYDRKASLKVSETVNQYLDGATFDQYESKLESGFNNQGVMEETFTDSRFASRKDADFVIQGVITKREQYPLVQIGTTTTNFLKGITSSTANQAFDYYSGQVTSSKTVDGYGNCFLTEVLPAYRKYGLMGLYSLGGKNMIIQEAAKYTYKVNPSNTSERTGLVSASVQTWSNKIPAVVPNEAMYQAITQPNIWRRHANFSFIGDNSAGLSNDGLFPYSGFVIFDAWDPDVPVTTGWQKNAEFSLFDVNSNTLEAIDINNLSGSTLMSNDQSRMFATAENCGYREFAFTGTEEPTATPNNGFSGRILQGEGVIDVSKYHTGKSSLRMDPLKKGFQFTLNTSSDRKHFMMSAWINATNATSSKFHFEIWKDGLGTEPLNSGSVQLTSNAKKAGDWYLFEAKIPIPPNASEKIEYIVKGWFENTSSSLPVWIDDFRIHPYDASMTSYVYNQWGELSHILDHNNLYTEYRYDNIGRLVETRRESFQFPVTKTAEYIYHHANN